MTNHNEPSSSHIVHINVSRTGSTTSDSSQTEASAKPQQDNTWPGHSRNSVRASTNSNPTRSLSPTYPSQPLDPESTSNQEPRRNPELALRSSLKGWVSRLCTSPNLEQRLRVSFRRLHRARRVRRRWVGSWTKGCVSYGDCLWAGSQQSTCPSIGRLERKHETLYAELNRVSLTSKWRIGDCSDLRGRSVRIYEHIRTLKVRTPNFLDSSMSPFFQGAICSKENSTWFET